MTIEHAIARAKPKPWGSVDLAPRNQASISEGPIGELWFERPDAAAPETKLLLKLLFTTEPLSIQVHPDDAFARPIGLSNGKTEAWYILSAVPGAQVAVGLNCPRSAAELRAAITDGSMATIVHWHPVHQGDIISIPAGTIHAIGAGIVLAEIQQHSDATFRLFDYGRNRELHIENAISVAKRGLHESQSSPQRLSSARIALTNNPYFVLERIDILPGSSWTLNATIFAIGGDAQLGLTKLSLGGAVFLEADQAEISAGTNGLQALLAYSGPSVDPHALTEHGAGADRAVHQASGATPTPISFGHALLEQPEKPTWPL